LASVGKTGRSRKHHHSALAAEIPGTQSGREHLAEFMRDNWLSNRVFKSYDDLVNHCCYAWNKLVDQPWKIMSIGLRQWAHGF
jgi:hypothetical protein